MNLHKLQETYEYNFRAFDIEWDDRDTREMPDTVDIPFEIVDQAIHQYLTEKYNICIDGYRFIDLKRKEVIECLIDGFK